MFRGHTASVLDTDWNPFDDEMVASGSDDGKIGIWKVPSDYNVAPENAEDIKDVSPVKFLSGHSKKVGHLQWHPVANNILVSSSHDYSLKVWDVEQSECLYTLQHPDLVTSFSFSYDGSLIATTSRDKIIRVWDIRAEKIISQGSGHSGAKSSRVVWLGNSDRIATTGFSRLSDRQLALWNISDIAAGPIGGFTFLDASAGICMPFYDDGTRCLYLAGKGDGNIRYFEFVNDEFFPLSEYQSVDPQRGVAVLPKKAVAVHDHEVLRFFKTVNDTTIEPVSFIVPRRSDTFQDDIYPDCFAGVAALSSTEWKSGKNSFPKVISMSALFEGSEPSPTVSTGEEAKVIKEQVSKDNLNGSQVKDAINERNEKKNSEKGEAKTVANNKSELTTSVDISKKGNGVETIFKSSEVNSFLKKASEEKDHPDDKYQESGWNSDDDNLPTNSKSRKPSLDSEAKIENESGSEGKGSELESKESKTEAKESELEVKESEIEVKESEPEVKESETGVKESKSEIKNESAPKDKQSEPEAETKAEHTADVKTATNKKSLEDRVDLLSQSVDALLEQIKLRDNRIELLEKKVSALSH